MVCVVAVVVIGTEVVGRAAVGSEIQFTPSMLPFKAQVAVDDLLSDQGAAVSLLVIARLDATLRKH